MTEREAEEHMTLANWLMGYANGVDALKHPVLVNKMARAADLLLAVHARHHNQKPNLNMPGAKGSGE